MKKLFSICLSVALAFTFTVSYTFADTNNIQNKELSTGADQQLVDRLIEKGTDVLYEGNKKIEKLPADNGCVQIGGLTEAQKKDIQIMDVYTITDTDVAPNEEQAVTTIADIQFITPEITTSAATSDSGTKTSKGQKGRLTLTSTAWYSEKTFKSKNNTSNTGRKVTKIQSQITKAENAGLVYNKIQTQYIGSGTYFTKAGARKVGGKYTKNYAHSVSTPMDKKVCNTSSIDRYYDIGGTGMCQTRFNVTYGGYKVYIAIQIAKN